MLRHRSTASLQPKHARGILTSFNQAKPTVAVIGTGWAGARFVKDINTDHCNVAVLSHRNHMVFTPLLPQTCTGTLEFRSICEPIFRIQPKLAEKPNAYCRTTVYDVDLVNKAIQCVSVGVLGSGITNKAPATPFEFHYDYLVLAHGARPNTFNCPGVEEHAFFLREVSEARGIRRRLVQNIMMADLPTTSREEARRLLHVVVVGGGPTGVEFAGDLADFLHEDVPKLAPSLRKEFRCTLVEANEVLGTFDTNLRNYGAQRLQKMGVELRKAVVNEVTQDSVILSDGEVLECGLCVWSTGVGPSMLNKALNVDKNKQGRLAIDHHLRVLKDGKPVPDVFAIGDCAANIDQPLPTLAAVASRQGKHLAININTLTKAKADEKVVPQVESLPPFHYKHVGSMANLGRNSALIEFKQPSSVDLKGLHAFLIWRSAYFTMLGSMRSRLYVFVNWMGSFIWGRDTTYIADLSEVKMWKSMASEGASKEQARKKAISMAKQQKKATLAVCKEKGVVSLTEEQKKAKEEALAKVAKEASKVVQPGVKPEEVNVEATAKSALESACAEELKK